MEVRTRIRNRLSDYKATSGLSNRELAKDLGISERTLYNYLRGNISNPNSKFTKNFKRRLYRRWGRIDSIPLRKSGAVVDLGEYFRSVWFDNGVFFRPYNLRDLPNYSFPPTAPVELKLEFKVQAIVDGIEQVLPSNEGGAWGFNIPNISPNDDILSLINERFEAYYQSTVRSVLSVTKIMKEKVLLRWLKNQKPPPMRERRMPRR